jgi:hypothetical protein
MGSYWREVGGADVGGRRFSGVYRAPIGATQRVASRREEGQQWKDRRAPAVSSVYVTSQCCSCMVKMLLVLGMVVTIGGWLG